MNKYCFILTITFTWICNLQAQKLEWATYYGGLGSESVTSLIIESDNDVISTGWWRVGLAYFDTFSLDCGNCSFLCEHSDSGKVKEVLTIKKGSIHDNINLKNGDIAVCGASNGNYIFGVAQPDSIRSSKTYIALLNKDREVKWITRCRSNSDGPFRLLERSNGEIVFAAGYFESYITPGGDTLVNPFGQREGIALVALDPETGRENWHVKIVETNSILIATNYTGIAECTNGDLIVSGEAFHKTKFLDGDTMTLDEISYILKLDGKEHKVMWKQLFQPSTEGGYVDMEGLVLDSEDNAYCVGTFYRVGMKIGKKELENYGNRDIFISKLDSTGKVLWARRAGGNNDDTGDGLALDDSNNVYIHGTHWDFSEIGDTVFRSRGPSEDIYIAKLSTDGDIKWAYSYGGRVDEAAYDIAISGRYMYITGMFGRILGGTGMNKWDFGGYILKSPGESGNIYLAKFDLSQPPDGEDHVRDLLREPLRVFPNPATDRLWVEGAADGAPVALYTATGQLVRRGTISGGGLSLAGLPSGLYLLQVQQPGGTVLTARVAKE